MNAGQTKTLSFLIRRIEEILLESTKRAKAILNRRPFDSLKIENKVNDLVHLYIPYFIHDKAPIQTGGGGRHNVEIDLPLEQKIIKDINKTFKIIYKCLAALILLLIVAHGTLHQEGIQRTFRPTNSIPKQSLSVITQQIRSSCIRGTTDSAHTTALQRICPYGQNLDIIEGMIPYLNTLVEKEDLTYIDSIRYVKNIMTHENTNDIASYALDEYRDILKSIDGQKRAKPHAIPMPLKEGIRAELEKAKKTPKKTLIKDKGNSQHTHIWKNTHHDYSLALENTAYYAKAQKYIRGLSPEDMDVIFRYVSASYVNVFLRDKHIDLSMTEYNTYKGFIGDMFRPEFNELYQASSLNTLDNKEAIKIKDIVKNVITRYAEKLSRIINQAPLTEEPFLVYRGVHVQKEFVKSPFLHDEGFVSTSTDTELPLFFADYARNASKVPFVYRILIPPRSRVLVLADFDNNQKEIILPAQSDFYLGRELVAQKRDNLYQIKDFILV